MVGWASTSAGEPAALRLVVAGQTTEACFEAVHRQDVLDALKLSTSARLGFRVDLPPLVWAEGDGLSRPVEICADEQTVAVPMPPDLESVLVHLRGGALDGASDDGLVAALEHVQAVGMGALSAETARWIEQVAAARGGWASAGAGTRSIGTKLHGQVERLDCAVLHGWAWVESADDETVSLHCDGAPVECSVIRIERNDVRSALHTERSRLGFEIEVPATLWSATAGTRKLALTVRVAGAVLNAEPLGLSHGQIVGWIEQLRVAEGGVPPDESAASRQERQYRTLLLLEHVAAAELFPMLDTRQQAFVLANAERFGLTSLFRGHGIPTVQGLPLPAMALQDLATLTNWRMMREFNRALGEGADHPLQALEQVLERNQVNGLAAQRFLWSITPYFCGRSMYRAIRPRLDAGRLRDLGESSSAYELSLMLPEAASSGDMRLAESAMKKLATATDGWLNTECIEQAIRIVACTPDVGTLRQQATVSFLDAFLVMLESVGDRGYWSRLHDAHLMGALIALLEALPRLTQGLAQWAGDFAVRRYALVPDFWRRLSQATPPVGGWPIQLLDARGEFECVQTLLTSLGAATDGVRVAGVRAIASLKASRNSDADIVWRELVMCCSGVLNPDPGTHAEVEMACLPMNGVNERLRMLAHPAAGYALSVGDSTVAEEIRALSGIAGIPRRRTVVELVAACLGSNGIGGVPARALDSAWRSVSQRENHYVGVRLACGAWLRGSEPWHTPEREAGLVELRELWFAAFDDCVDLPHPPAALTASFSQFAAAAQASASESMTHLVQEMRAALHGRYGPAAELAEQTRCASSAIGMGPTGYATLVAIYSCERNLTGRVQAIRETWAKELTALGIPWVVVVGGGNGQLDGDILRLSAPDDYESLPAKTLSLVEWVYRNTRVEHLIKIDDDCHLAVQAFFADAPFLSHHYHGRRLHRAVGATDRIWHQGKSRSHRAAHSADKTPEPSTYADGSSAYCLSRYAMAQVSLAVESTVGARLTRSAFLEDKLLGDLLATRNLHLSNEGHYTLIRRRFGPAAIPVNAWDNLFYPSTRSPTLVTHLDEHESMATTQSGVATSRLHPPRIWPTDALVRLSGGQTNQLELVSDATRIQALGRSPAIVIAVARNERVLMPHFLQHYRQMGVGAFVIVDNLSDDGTREYLLEQSDVVLYSADTEYRESHYGVSWQQAVLGAHAVGKWVILADIDEFLVYPECETRGVASWLSAMEQAGHDASRILMIDMYPSGRIEDADFTQGAPFELARCFDEEPLLRWYLGSGSFSNSPTYLSALRHRLIPDSAPNIYTSQKLAVVKYQPWVRFSEGLHYASNLRVAPEPAWFAHFKYHEGFSRKVQLEIARRQHFNGAEEYRKYASLLAEAPASLAQEGRTNAYADSRMWSAYR